MYILIIAIFLIIISPIYSCCVISGECSRIEEQNELSRLLKELN